MKNARIIPIFFLSVLLTACSQYKVFSVKDNPSLPVGGGVLYALPRTQLCVEMTVQRRDLSKAPYRDYAFDFLGVSEDDIDTSYRLVDIDVRSVNVADPDNYYYVQVNRGSVTVDDRHLLLAVGVSNPTGNVAVPDSPQPRSGAGHSSPNAAYNLYDRTDTLYTRYDAPGKPSLLTSRKDVRSTRQRAAAAAERLEEIQTKQQELLNGEYEGSYGAEAVQYLYAQLRGQEEELVALFCGSAKSEKVRFYVEPQMRRNEDFCDTVIWFSPQNGFVGDVDRLPSDAFAVICCVHSDNDLRQANRFVKYHTSGFTSNSSSGRTGTAASKFRSRKGFRYRIPSMATVEVTTPVYSVRRQLPLSQLGPVVELPRRRIKAVFDAQTLDLKELDRR